MVVTRVHFMVQVVRFAHANNKNWIFDIKMTKNVTHISYLYEIFDKKIKYFESLTVKCTWGCTPRNPPL